MQTPKIKILEQPVSCSFFAALKTHSGDPFDSLPKSYWYEFSSPFTESYDDLTEAEPRTTPDPLPFFEDRANSTNVTTQLGSAVFLHCKVNDLMDRTVSRTYSFRFSFKAINVHVFVVAAASILIWVSCGRFPWKAPTSRNVISKAFKQLLLTNSTYK
jgi:hypothetical protein